MNNKKKLYSRKIKCLGNCVNPGESILHPIFLQLLTNNTSKKVCPTIYHQDDQKSPIYYKKCTKDTDIKYDTIARYMSMPYLNIDPNKFIKIYNVTTINNLLNFIDTKLEQKYTYQHINRVINCWIKVNQTDLIKNNDILTNIYIKIFKEFWKNKKIDFNSKGVIQEINKFINNWFKNNQDDFDYNLGNTLKKYLNKKYG